MSKITLATLATATAQQVFDQVRDHMLRQMKRSMLHPTGSMCAYRSHDGLACAAGCLIGEDEYTRSLERSSWRELVRRGTVPATHAILIRALQEVHDAFMPEHWERELRDLAGVYGLAWTITLATLPTASAQEVFEQAAKHLLKQNAEALEDGGCVYRASDGRMCAAGCLISATEYTARMEERTWDLLVYDGSVPAAHESLICALQRVHDQNKPANWRGRLRELAHVYKLDSSFMDLLPVPYVPVSFRETASL